jgi:hypothetical protein
MSGNGNGNGNAVTNLSDDLIAKARAIANRSDELLELLEDARTRLLESDRSTSAKGRKPAPGRRFKPEPEARPKKGAGTDDVSEGLRLLTTQMSVAGADRAEIAERLKDEFAIKDPEPILKSMGL